MKVDVTIIQLTPHLLEEYDPKRISNHEERDCVMIEWRR